MTTALKLSKAKLEADIERTRGIYFNSRTNNY